MSRRIPLPCFSRESTVWRAVRDSGTLGTKMHARNLTAENVAIDEENDWPAAKIYHVFLTSESVVAMTNAYLPSFSSVAAAFF